MGGVAAGGEKEEAAEQALQVPPRHWHRTWAPSRVHSLLVTARPGARMDRVWSFVGRECGRGGERKRE